MELIYSNFDGLDVSFQGALPGWILDKLRDAKIAAQQDRRDFPLSLDEDLMVQVGESGAKGGYAFRFDTGLDGETWFIKDSQKADDWNIRVSCKSLALALHGYEGMKARILDTLTSKLRVNVKEGNKVTRGIPLERVSRFDYCMDFAMEEFFPSSENIVSHSRCSKKYHHDIKAHVVDRGKHVESLRIGEIPNRQICIYDKIKEITANRKSYWWKIWNIAENDFEKQIWRIEVRAGKNELNKWNVRRFSDFEKHAGDIVQSILLAIRYAIPQNDINRSRWPNTPLWDFALKTVNENLFSFISNVKRDEIIQEYLENMDEWFEKHILGSFISHLAISGKELTQEEFVFYIEKMKEKGLEKISTKNNKTVSNYLKAKARNEATLFSKEKNLAQ